MKSEGMKNITTIPKVKYTDNTLKEHIEIVVESREAIKKGYVTTLEEFLEQKEE